MCLMDLKQTGKGHLDPHWYVLMGPFILQLSEPEMYFFCFFGVYLTHITESRTTLRGQEPLSEDDDEAQWPAFVFFDANTNIHIIIGTRGSCLLDTAL